METYARNLIDLGLNSDQVKQAFASMKEFYGDAFDSILSAEGSEAIVAAWLEPIEAAEGAIVELLKDSGDYADIFDILTEGLGKDGYSPEDIAKSYRILWRALNEGIISFEEINKLLQTGDSPGDISVVVDNYEHLLGQLNGVISATEALDAKTKDIHDEWDGYINDIASGKTTDAFNKLTGMIDEIVEIQSLYTVAKSGKDGYLEAQAKLLDMAGTSDLAAVERYLKELQEDYNIAITYLMNSRFSAGVEDFLKEISAYANTEDKQDGAIKFKSIYWNQLYNMALENLDDGGEAFLEGDYINALFAKSGMDNAENMLYTVMAITDALEDGRMSWGDLSKAIDKATDATGLYMKAIEATEETEDDNDIDDLGDVSTEADEDTNAEQAVEEYNDMRDAALDYARAVADLHILEAEGVSTRDRSEALGRLYERYNTTSLDFLRARADADGKAVKDWVDQNRESLMNVAGVDLKSSLGLGDNGELAPHLAAKTFLEDFAKISEDSLNATAALDGFISKLELSGLTADEQAAAYYMLYDAIENGSISWQHLGNAVTAAGENLFTFNDIVSMIDDGRFQTMLENIEGLSDLSAADKASFMRNVAGEAGSDEAGDGLADLLETIKHYHDLGEEGEEALETIQDELGISDELFEDMLDGTLNAADGLNELRNIARNFEFKALEEAGKILADTSDAFDMAAKGGEEFENYVASMGGELYDLMDAWDAMQVLLDQSKAGTDEFTTALSVLSSYLGWNEQYLVNNLPSAFSILQNRALDTQNTI